MNVISTEMSDYDCPRRNVRRDAFRRNAGGVGVDYFFSWLGREALIFLVLLFGMSFAASLARAEGTNAVAETGPTSSPRFDVETYVVNYNATVFSNAPTVALTAYTGTNDDLERIVAAATEVLKAFRAQGYTNANISIAQDRITNGVVTMNVYRGLFAQILVSGKTYFRLDETNGATMIAGMTEATNSAAAPVKTNVVAHFSVQTYSVTGDTLLSTNTLKDIFVKATGTNITLADILKAASDLQLEYRDRGFPTVNVTIPPQQITNGVVKIRVFEGKLSEIEVTHNHYFSSNNVMRSLPSLHTNTILLRPVFQAELDRANVNQDRQIYPRLQPGPEPNTTVLDLVVKDRLPLHAKIELNNQSSPGTPDLRINSSAVYNNLWQMNQSLGVQYSFSPELYKAGSIWNFYDKPLVANYSGFYRVPLGDPEAISDVVASQPGTFGYNEATRKFVLPPASGVPELNFYASRSTIDTGVEGSDAETLFNSPGVRVITRQDNQQDLTINNTLGFRFSTQLPEVEGIESSVSAGFDYKTYDLDSFKTNNFNFVEITLNQFNQPNPPVVSTVSSPVPATFTETRYLPFSLRYDGSRKDASGLWTGNFGYSVNFLGSLFSNSDANFQKATGSTHGDGSYQILTAGLGREQTIYGEWKMNLHADGQWANQPLISNEQFGTGGVGSVRGYHEGEVFGDTGWHVTLEQKTPGHIVGLIGRKPLIFRGSVYMDYAESYLLDPQGRDRRTPLWGTGFGVVASVGTTWEARFLFSLPLLEAPTIEAYQPYFNFSLTAQF